MLTNRLGIHHLRYHPDDKRDFAHFRKLRPASYKPFEWMWSNQPFAEGVLAALPADCIILARDHPLSEQHDDMWRDPEGTGKRHADEWEAKIKGGAYHFPPERSYFLGLNEMDAVKGDRTAIDIYWAAFGNRLTTHGRRGGFFNFSTGHPRTKNGTNHPSDRKDYAFFARSYEALKRNGGIAIQHIYGSATNPLVPGHFDALRDCPWPDVTWVIGEVGINEYVVNGGTSHDGYKRSLKPIESYPQWMERLIRGVNDPRIHSWMVFTYDYSNPWGDKDVSGVTAPSVAAAFEAWNWKGLDLGVTPPVTPPVEPPVTPVPAGKVVHPLPGARLTQHWGQNADAYARFGLWGHNGTDLAMPSGTPVRCIADGGVAYADTDSDYGNYVRVWHAELGAWSFYAHLLKPGSVKVGQKVKAGETIGLVGSTGNSTGPHLHLEIRDATPDGSYNGSAPMSKGRVDPETWCSLHGLKL